MIVFLSALIGGLQAHAHRQDARVAGARDAEAAGPRSARIAPAAPGEAVVASVEKAPERERSIEQWQRLLATVRSRDGVVAATPTAAGSAFASRGELSKSVAIRGIDLDTFDSVIRMARQGDGRALLASRGPRRSSGACSPHDLGVVGRGQDPDR